MAKSNKEKKQNVVRKPWGAQIDITLIDNLKHLSVDLKKPVYLLAEEAFKMLIDSKRLHLDSKKRKKN